MENLGVFNILAVFNILKDAKDQEIESSWSTVVMEDSS